MSNPLKCWQGKQFLNFVLVKHPYFLYFINGMSTVVFSDRRPAEMCILPEVKRSKVLNINAFVGTREKLTESCLSLVRILWLWYQFYSSLQNDNQMINQSTSDNNDIIACNSIT